MELWRRWRDGCGMHAYPTTSTMTEDNKVPPSRSHPELIAYLFCQSYALCTQSENTSVRRASNDAQVTKFCLKRCIAVRRLRPWPPRGRYEVVERLVDAAQSGGMSKDDVCSQFRTALSSLMECTLVSIRFCFHWARFADK